MAAPKLRRSIASNQRCERCCVSTPREVRPGTVMRSFIPVREVWVMTDRRKHENETEPDPISKSRLVNRLKRESGATVSIQRAVAHVERD
jgi:hypothetical protein